MATLRDNRDEIISSDFSEITSRVFLYFIWKKGRFRGSTVKVGLMKVAEDQRRSPPNEELATDPLAIKYIHMNYTFDRIAYNHWQLSTSNIAIFCPYDDTCMGGTYRLNYTVNGTQVLFNDYFLTDQCFEDYSGPLCSKPSETDYFIDPITRDSTSCIIGDGANVGYLYLFFFAIFFLLYFCYIICYVRVPLPPQSVALQSSSRKKTTKKSANGMSALIWLRLVLFYFQLMSQSPTALSFHFPPTASIILKIFGFTSLSSILLVPFECFSSPSDISSETEVSYHHKMYLSTILPIGFMFSILLITFILNEIAYLDNPLQLSDFLEIDDIEMMERDEEDWTHDPVVAAAISRQYQQFNYFYKLVTIIYFFNDLWIGNISQLLFGSLFCVQLNDNSNLSETDFVVLWNDPSVLCHQEDFFSVFTIMWVAGSILFFLVILPLIEIAIIRSLRKGQGEKGKADPSGHSKLSSNFSSRENLSNRSLFRYIYEGYSHNGLGCYERTCENLFRVVVIGVFPILLTQQPRVYKTIGCALLSVIFFTMIVKLRPFLNPRHQWFLEFSLLTNIFILFTIMTSQIGVFDLDENTPADIAISCSLLAPLAIAVHGTIFSRVENGEDEESHAETSSTLGTISTQDAFSSRSKRSLRPLQRNYRFQPWCDEFNESDRIFFEGDYSDHFYEHSWPVRAYRRASDLRAHSHRKKHRKKYSRDHRSYQDTDSDRQERLSSRTSNTSENYSKRNSRPKRKRTPYRRIAREAKDWEEKKEPMEECSSIERMSETAEKVSEMSGDMENAITQLDISLDYAEMFPNIKDNPYQLTSETE